MNLLKLTNRRAREEEALSAHAERINAAYHECVAEIKDRPGNEVLGNLELHHEALRCLNRREGRIPRPRTRRGPVPPGRRTLEIGRSLATSLANALVVGGRRPGPGGEDRDVDPKSVVIGGRKQTVMDMSNFIAPDLTRDLELSDDSDWEDEEPQPSVDGGEIGGGSVRRRPSATRMSGFKAVRRASGRRSSRRSSATSSAGLGANENTNGRAESEDGWEDCDDSPAPSIGSKRRSTKPTLRSVNEVKTLLDCADSEVFCRDDPSLASGAGRGGVGDELICGWDTPTSSLPSDSGVSSIREESRGSLLCDWDQRSSSRAFRPTRSISEASGGEGGESSPRDKPSREGATSGKGDGRDSNRRGSDGSLICGWDRSGKVFASSTLNDQSNGSLLCDWDNP